MVIAEPQLDRRPTLILLHGATLNGHMWDPIRRSLHPDYRILAPDLPGHGARRHQPFELQSAVDIVHAAARSVVGSPVVVAGDSLGGYTALAAAGALPVAQLKGLVLGGSSSNLIGTAVVPYVTRCVVARTGFAIGMERFLTARGHAALRRLPLDPDDVQAMWDAGIHLRAFCQAVSALRGIDFRSRLAAVEQPVLLINGSKDRGHIAQEASFLAVARHGMAVRLPDCGHGVTLLRPAEVAALINDFSARVFA
jgi:pimeloyl-ACP methyl ester carboxylesterase